MFADPLKSDWPPDTDHTRSDNDPTINNKYYCTCCTVVGVFKAELQCCSVLFPFCGSRSSLSVNSPSPAFLLLFQDCFFFFWLLLPTCHQFLSGHSFPLVSFFILF